MHDSLSSPETRTVFVNVDGVCVEVHDFLHHQSLRLFCALYEHAHDSTEPDLRITAQANGLHCEWILKDAKPLKYHIDIGKFTQQHRSYPAAKQGALNQALGKKTKHILDATAGWGGDALLMCAQGYTVTLLERSPIMALLLDDAMARLAASEWAEHNEICVPNIIHADAITFLQQKGTQFDCIYLDPMFPPKRKKTAAVNKRLQLLQWMVGSDSDASQLLKSAIDFPCARVVVKRPDYAEPLGVIPSQQFSSKLVHYDVYLNSQLHAHRPNSASPRGGV